MPNRTPATRNRPHDLRVTLPTGPATTTRVRPDPEAWAKALELAEGDASRLEVRDAGLAVYVHNS